MTTGQVMPREKLVSCHSSLVTVVMKPERWKQVDELLEAALECPAAERASFLDRACAGDEELRREIASLLISDGQAKGFIESPPAKVAADLFADTHPKPRSGERIAHYEILAPIGSGGMGEVYLAQDARLGRKVALKLLPAAFSTDQDRLRRFEQEARAAGMLNHPNVLTIYDIGTHEGAPYIVSELLTGETLAEGPRKAPLPLQRVIDYALQMA